MSAVRATRVCLPAPVLSLLPGLLALALAVLPPAAASGEFGQARLLSGTARQQFEEANAPVLSADGRYAVFQGRLDGVSGVWRRDLGTGEVVPVAAAYDPENSALGAPEPGLSAPDAAAPSVSAGGRYIAFTTTHDLDPQAEPAGDGGCPEVYVRDMEPAAGEPAYTLAAALNGTSQGIAYEGGCPSPSGSGLRVAGAQAAAGAALSADGRHVVFTVLSRSNLAGPGTDPSQVAVRDLDTDTTTLVTAIPAGQPGEGQPVKGGGAFPSTESLARGSLQTLAVGVTPSQAPYRYGDQASAATAAISADASAVAWLGTNVPAQVAAGEAARAPALPGPDAPGLEVEPLWRGIADGQGAPARRLLAGAGLDFFYEGINERGVDPVIAGSLVGIQESRLFLAPALSADGRTAGVLASAPPPAVEPSLTERRNTGLSDLSTDAYAVRVGVGDPASPPAVTPLTEIPSYLLPSAATEDVKDLAVSPDGTRVAFDTARTQPYLPALAQISPPVAFTQTAESYEANLTLGTLQRVTSTYDGSEPNGEAGLLSFAGDGRSLAFASLATNLFFGDGVGAWEAYEAPEAPIDTPASTQEIGPPPPPPAASPAWLLSVTAAPEPDGSVLVLAQVPGAGRLAVKAGAQLPAGGQPAARGASDRAGAHGTARVRAAAAGTRKDKRGGTKRRAGQAVPARTVAQLATSTRGPTEVRLRLRVGAAYRRLLAGNGLYAVLRVTFAAPGHRTLAAEVPVTFRLRKRRSRHKRAKR